MPKLKSIVDRTARLEKFSGKGGWTFILIPEIEPAKKPPFGWVQVKGSIDNYNFKQVKLMPKGNGQLFLPVKAAIRKAIKKEAGAEVHLTLDLDLSKLTIPQEILFCLKDEPKAYAGFDEFTDGEKKAYLDWINEAKRAETKIKRIVELIDRAKNGLKFGE